MKSRLLPSTQREIGPASQETIPLTKTLKKSRSWESLTSDTWLWEATSMIFSVLCFVGIFCILLIYDQNTIPNLPSGLTLNTIISILATGSKSSLILVVGECLGQLKWIWFQREKRPLHDLQPLDDASRGPLGCVTVLTQHKGCPLISLGAVITILALLLDPFVQQVVRYPTRQVPSTSSTAMAPQSGFPFPSDSYSDEGLKSAMQAGIWTDHFDITPSCPSGNCTWPTFRSVGWCSKCEDVTPMASLVGCHDISFNTSLQQPQWISCNVSLQHGTWANTPIVADPTTTAVDPGDFEITVPKDVIWMVNEPSTSYMAAIEAKENNTFLGVTNPVLALGHAELELSEMLHPEKGLRIVKVTECILSTCAKPFDFSVSEGVSSVEVDSSSMDFGDTFVYHGTTRNEESGVMPLTTSCWKTNLGHPISPKLANSNDFLSAWANGSEFTICPAAGPGTFRDSLTGIINASTTYDTSVRTWTQGSSPNTANPYTLQKIVSSGLEKASGNIAASLTKYAFDTSNATIHGKVMVNQVYVDVDWVFLTLPATILGLTIVFFASVVLVNKSRDLRLWKTSPLPGLYHGLDNSLLPDGDEHATLAQMERTSQDVNVQLRFSESKGRLILRK